MTRRDVLCALAAVLAAAANFVRATRRAAAAPALNAATASSAVANDLANHFSYLTFKDGTVESFVAAYEAAYGKPNLQNPMIAQSVHTKFLLSTDFFQNGADEKLALRFVALHDPYVTPCYNPLAAALNPRPR